MSIRIVTDSTSDISPEVAQALGITVVPVYVRFGNDVFRDGVDLSNAGFYQKLLTAFVHPSTSQPTPQDFATVYSECAKEAESIVSIHISAKISRTYNSALLGHKMAKGTCQIEVIDSNFSSVGLALVVMAAARLAQAGGDLQNVLQETRKAINQVRLLGIVDTMKYLVLGRRINKATAAVADIFQIKPVLTFKNGDIVRTGLVRTYSRGVDRLYEFVENRLNIQDVAIAYSTAPELAHQMKKRLSSTLPGVNIYVAELGAALGVHTGPGAMVVALRQAD